MYVGIEDQDNWHGKPLGAKAEGAIAEISKHIKNSGQHGLCPATPEQVLQEHKFGNVKMTEPPNYKLGDMVRHWHLVIYLVAWPLSLNVKLSLHVRLLVKR